MKKLVFLLFAVLLLVSCTENDGTGYLSITAEQSRGITASIEYPTLLDKVWNLTAEKLDNKGNIGEGTYDDVLLTDTIGVFSIGEWRFTITDSENKITGYVTTTIKAGANRVGITVHSTASKGTLIMDGCNLLLSKEGDVTKVDLYVDEQRVNTQWLIENLSSEDGDYYVLPDVSVQLTEGTHTIRLYYALNNGGRSSDTVRVRIVNGAVTRFTIGEQEGNLYLTVSFDTVEALEE